MDFSHTKFSISSVLNFSETNSKSLMPVKRVYFSGPYSLQNWSLPDSIIFYIAKHPLSAKLFQKLVQMCKYFFIKNPIIIIDLSNQIFCKRGIEGLEDVLKKTKKNLNISFKYWITGKEITPTSKIIPHLYRVDVKQLNLFNQVLSFNDFVFISKNIEIIDLFLVNLKNENGTIIPLEKLVEALPNLKSLSVNQCYDRYLITSKTMKELLKIEHFSKINYIRFFGLTDAFDIETFYDYMKKNKLTQFYFAFSYPLSNAYLNRLNEIMDEVIGTQNHDYKVPCIHIPHMKAW